jgi:hypothetical protein
MDGEKDEPQALRLYVAATKRTPNVEPQCLRLKPILIDSNYISRGLCFQYRLLFIISAGVYGFNIVIVHYISRGLCFQYRHLFIISAGVYVFNIVICSLYQQGVMFSISSFVHYISRGLCFQYRHLFIISAGVYVSYETTPLPNFYHPSGVTA